MPNREKLLEPPPYFMHPLAECDPVPDDPLVDAFNALHESMAEDGIAYNVLEKVGGVF